MAHKSHRQKALQAQLETAPSISLVSSSKRAPLPKPSASSSKGKAPKDDAGMEVDGTASDDEDDNDEVLIAGPSKSQPASAAEASGSSSGFAPLPAQATSSVLKNEFRRIAIPPHRMSPLKRDWVNLYTPLVEMLGLQVRMNVPRRSVELKVSQSPRSTQLAY